MKQLLILTLLTMTACSHEIVESNVYELPDGLRDCKVYERNSEWASPLIIVRCPNSTTSTTFSVGKTTGSTVVIDNSVTDERAKDQ